MSNIKINNGPTSTVSINGTGSTITINSAFLSTIGISKQQINLTYSAVLGALTYIIERATDSGFTDVEQVFAGNATSFYDTGLSQNTTYYYRVSWADESTETIMGTVLATTLNIGVTYDIDTEAFIEAIKKGVTPTTQHQEDIDDFVLYLKANSLWSKVKTIHIGKFGNMIANSVNLRNPDFNIEGFPALFSGAITHNPTKISFAGAGSSSEATATKAFSTIWLNPSVYLSQDNKGYTFNITDAPTGTTTSDQYIFGTSTVSPNTGDRLSLRGLPVGTQQNDEARLSSTGTTNTNFLIVNLPALYTFQRSGSLSSNVLLRRNSVDILTTLDASTGNVNLPLATDGYFSNSVTTNSLGSKTYGRDFFAVHESFDSTEMTNWELAINTLITALNS